MCTPLRHIHTFKASIVHPYAPSGLALMYLHILMIINRHGVCPASCKIQVDFLSAVLWEDETLKPCGAFSSLCCIHSPYFSLSVLELSVLLLPQRTHGTKHELYSLCVFLIIGSKVAWVFESFQRTPKQAVWVQSLCSDASSPRQAFVDLLQHDCQSSHSLYVTGQVLKSPLMVTRTSCVNMFGIWVTGPMRKCIASILIETVNFVQWLCKKYIAGLLS